jgi:hypothetical protein
MTGVLRSYQLYLKKAEDQSLLEVFRGENIFTFILKEDTEIEKPVYGFMTRNGKPENNCYSEKGSCSFSFNARFNRGICKPPFILKAISPSELKNVFM